MRRRRKTLNLVMDGIDLYNTAYEDLSPTRTITPTKRSCFRDLVKNMFTSEYDDVLKQNEKNLRNSSAKLCGFLKNPKEVNNIPTYIDNAVFNIILDILTDRSDIRTFFDCKKMYHHYTTLAKIAFKNDDHNTCIVIKCALEHTVIKRLDIKQTKTEKKLFEDFEQTYGTFLNCYSKHIEQLLTSHGTIIDFIPSVLVLNMHLKKNEIYTDAYTKLGKYPKKLAEKRAHLMKVMDAYGQYYVSYRKFLVRLYLVDPMQHSVFTSGKYKGGFTETLFEMVNEIHKNNNGKKKLKRNTI